MSYDVTALVRKARLPRTLKRRPLAKAVLLAFADRCDKDGGEARPSMRTVADEVEASARLIPVVCRDLERHHLITEQAPPGQHRPRTWRLNLPAIAALADQQHVADLTPPDQQDVADLKTDLTSQTARHDAADLNSSGRQIQHPGRQIFDSDLQHVADDPVLLNSPLNKESTAASPRLASASTPKAATDNDGRRTTNRALSREPAADGNFKVGLKLAHTVMEATGNFDHESPDLVEDFKRACAVHHIDYSEPDFVRRVLELAATQRRLGIRTRGIGSIAAMADAFRNAPDAETLGRTLKALDHGKR